MSVFSLYRKQLFLLLMLLMGQRITSEAQVHPKMVDRTCLSGTLQIGLPAGFTIGNKDTLDSIQQGSTLPLEAYTNSKKDIWILLNVPEYQIVHFSEMDTLIQHYVHAVKNDSNMQFKSSGTVTLSGIQQKAKFIEYFQTKEQEERYVYVLLFSPDILRELYSSLVFFTFFCPKSQYARNKSLLNQILQTIKPKEISSNNLNPQPSN